MKNKTCCVILIVLGVLVILGAIASGVAFGSVFGGRSRTLFPRNTYLVVDVTGPIGDYDGAPTLEPWIPRPPALVDILDALKRAAHDPRIIGLLLRPSNLTGFSTARELREAVLRFKESGKPVYAYLELATDRDYYLASVADTIIVHPARSGGLIMLGLGIASTYLADTFEKIGLKFHVLHVGRYKGAFENLGSSRMSTPLRESLQALLDDLYATYTSEILAARRRLPETVLEEELQRGRKLFITGTEAVDKGFADLSLDWGDVRERLKRGEKFRTVSAARYARLKRPRDGAREIAVVFASGEIAYSSGQQAPWDFSEGIRAAEFVKLLRGLRENKRVEAVVLRVNSPGGSALASEIILQEVRRLREKKPVIVSMGNMAASGGYYLSCEASHIIAHPTTVTGSIGVVGLVTTGEELFRKIGARVETVQQGKWMNYIRFDKDLNDEQRAVLLDYMRGVYDDFTAHVAVGRKLSAEELDAAAQGRVWSGTQALEHKLVDELGGLDLALQRAEEMAGIPHKEVRVRYYPRPQDLFTYLSGRFGGTMRRLGQLLQNADSAARAQQALQEIARFVRQRDFVQTVLPMQVP